MKINYEKIIYRDNGECQYIDCDVSLSNQTYSNKIEIAHKIIKGTTSYNAIAKYVWNKYKITILKKEMVAIIQDDDNLICACKNHNQFFTIHPGSRPIEFNEHLDRLLKKHGIIK